MTLTEFKDWAGVVEFLGGMTMIVVALWAKVNFVTRSDHKIAFDKVDADLKKQSEETARRLTSVELVAAGCVSREQMQGLVAQMNELTVDSREVAVKVEALNERVGEQLPQIRGALTRIEDYLLAHAK